LMELFHGPDFATGGVIVDSPQAISHAYETGRGAFRVRGRFRTEEAKEQADKDAGIERLGGGQYQLVVSEIPYMVQKGKLIEQIAQLIADRKLPILEDVRDESDEKVRIVLVPKSRNIDPELLKESLYKLTDLESRFSLNLNVLDATRTPMVMGLRELLTHWVTSQIDILQRRAAHRLDKIAQRLELLEGYIIAFLNLDRVIEIIRTEDEPKPVMIAEFGLNDRQAEAILNMRLRSLRRLEEMQLRKEHDELLAERDGLEKLLGSPALQRSRLTRDLRKLRKDYAEDTILGRRRTTIAEARPVVELMPVGVASPYAWVSWSKSRSVAPPPARARRASGSTRTARMADRSMTSPSSHKALPAMLWPPPRTASGRPWLRAKATAASTSAVPLQRAMKAGRRSIIAFQMLRASS
ncbi:MAG: hypothetical protein EOO78_10845, partial [Oxalobacteraceae bacterium]